MISWIIFILGTIVSTTLGYFCCKPSFAIWQILVIFIIALIILVCLNAICAIICAKILPNKMYNNKMFNPGKKEIALYNKLNIKAWKDKTIEWGKLNGFSKSKIENPKDPEYIKKFILECKKGFLGHFTSLFIAGFIFLCVPKSLILSMALPMFITSFILNYIPIIILRYNSHRLSTLLRFIERNQNKQINT